MTNNLNSVKSSASAKRSSYHHGNLRETLLTGAEEILRERGASGFSLREAARRAGVSPGAPAHHFGDSRGLLTAVAARGFERLAEQLEVASQGARRDERVKAVGNAYLVFARENEALFGIMWMRDLLDQKDPDYLAAGRAAFNVLEEAALGQKIAVATTSRVPDASVLAAWAMIHGLARLTLDGALDVVPAETHARVLDLACGVTQPHK